MKNYLSCLDILDYLEPQNDTVIEQVETFEIILSLSL